MKKVILLFAIGLAITGLPSCGNDTKDKDKDKKEISAASVPEAVKSAFSAKYSTATDVKWEDAHEDDKQTYKAKFMLGDKKMKAEFDADGNLIKQGDDN